MYSENKEIASRIDEVVTKIARSIDINEWDLIDYPRQRDSQPKKLPFQVTVKCSFAFDLINLTVKCSFAFAYI